MTVTFIDASEGGLDQATTAQATAATNMWNGSLSGTVTSATDQAFGSIYSMKCDATATPASAYRARLACLAQAGSRVHMNVRFGTAWGNSAYTGFFRALTSAAAETFSVQVNDTGLLRISSLGGGTSGTYQLALSTWYKMTIAFTITSATVYTINVFVDGTVRVSLTNTGTLTNVAATQARFGWTGSVPTANALVWLDNIVVDDGTTLDDVAQIYVTNKRPAGLGDLNQFDTLLGSGTNRWDRVSEVPVNTTNGLTQAGSGVAQENFTLQALGVGDVNLTGATILAHAGWLYVNSGGAGTPGIMHAGTITAITAVNAIRHYYNLVADSTYPSTNQAIGCRSGATVNDTILYECGILIAYRPGKAPPPLLRPYRIWDRRVAG